MLKRIGIITILLSFLILSVEGKIVKNSKDKKKVVEDIKGREYQKISAENNKQYDLILVSKSVKDRNVEVIKLNKYFIIDMGYQLINEFHLIEKLTFDQKKEFINLLFNNLDKNGSEHEFVIMKYFDDGTNAHFFIKYEVKKSEETENFKKYFGKGNNITGYIKIETNAPIYSVTDMNFNSKYVVDKKKSLDKIPDAWVYKRKVEIYIDKPIFNLKTLGTIEDNIKYLPLTAFELLRDQDFENDGIVKKSLHEKLDLSEENQSKENNYIRLNLVLYYLINNDLKNAKMVLDQIKKIDKDSLIEIIKKYEFGEGQKKVSYERKELIDINVIKNMMEDHYQLMAKI